VQTNSAEVLPDAFQASWPDIQLRASIGGHRSRTSFFLHERLFFIFLQRPEKTGLTLYE